MAFLQVNGVDVKTPNEFQVNIQDVSAPDSGRDIQGKMWKNTVGQKRTIALRWNYITKAEMQTLLAAFSPVVTANGVQNEYFTVTYYDPLSNNSQVTKTFYLGDRSSPLYNWTLGLYESLSFNIIER